MKKIRDVITKVLQIIGSITVIVTIVLLAGFLFNQIFPMEVIREAYRITSPNGKVDVVGMYRDAGATTSQTEHIYVVPTGHVITAMDRVLDRYAPVFVGDHITEKNVHWIDDRTLEIQDRSARIFNYKNYVRPFFLDAKYMVDIRLSSLRE